jgi:ferric-dicitrate binding protein FerR (iron transport regulator)
MNHCPNTQDNIKRHLEGEQNNNDEQALQDHLTKCPACAAAFKQMDLLEEVVKDAVMPEIDMQKAAAHVTQRLAQQQAIPTHRLAACPIGLGRVRQFAGAAALLLIGVGLGLLCQSYWQTPNAIALKPVDLQVTEVKGIVLVKHQNAQVWQALNTDSQIYQGDTFYTTATSNVVLALDQTNRIEVTPNSMLALESYENKIQLYLEHGQCTPVLNGPHGPFFIRTPNGTMEALGTEFTVKVTE